MYVKLLVIEFENCKSKSNKIIIKIYWFFAVYTILLPP